MSIATNLFDLTRKLHGLSPSDRRLLRLATLVHDVGRAINDDEHPQHGADMIETANALRLTAAERRALRYLTLYHRGRVPEGAGDDVLAETDDRDRLRTILALLRTADALDNRTLKSPNIVFALDRRCGATVLTVHCYLTEDSAKARRVYRKRKKFAMLEDLLGIDLDIEIHVAQSLRLVA